MSVPLEPSRNEEENTRDAVNQLNGENQKRPVKNSPNWLVFLKTVGAATVSSTVAVGAGMYILARMGIDVTKINPVIFLGSIGAISSSGFYKYYSRERNEE